MVNNERKGELIRYLNAIWRRKWLILIPSFALGALAGVASFFLPKVWEVDAIIQPGKFLYNTDQGQIIEVVPIDPRQIVVQINQKSYDGVIAAQLNIDIRRFPKLKAEVLRDTKLVRMVIRDTDISRAKAVLQSLSNYLKAEMDRKVDIERSNIDTEITTKELNKSLKTQEIERLANKLKIIEKREKEIIRETMNFKERIKTLEEAQKAVLKEENKSEGLALGLVLYSNEIQESLRDVNTLNELLSKKGLEYEDTSQQKTVIEKEIEQMTNLIKNLKERKGRIDYAKLIKEPMASLNPVSPKKKLNILLGGILGLFMFTMAALFLDYLERQKDQLK